MARDYPKSEILDIIERKANERGIPRDDFLRFAYIETGGSFDETVNRGPNGAKGLFQFVPGTARQYGIEGRELDPVANTDAAARLYLDNRQILVNRHASDGIPYLSGKPDPHGLDMYLAHQQGAAGYRSIQTAISTGRFGRADTRANILNNVARSDLERVTGVDYSSFRGMSDRDMARTFTQYWDSKFDRVQIPEKGIAAVTAAPSPAPARDQPTAGISLERAHALTLQYDHVRYGLGQKNPGSGRVDCSGWVVALQNATMQEINAKAGRQVFTRGDEFRPGWDGAAMIIEIAQKRSGVLLQGREVTASALREGMVIGEDNGPKSWDAGRYKGIDHVVMVVRDPRDGQLKVSQSRGGEGVELSPLDDYLRNRHARGVKLFATDPLHNARELLHDRAPGHERSTLAGPQPSAAEPVLRKDACGAEVKELQTMLARFGYGDAQGRPLAVDSQFGQRTEEAVKAFQRAHGLAVDGVAGPNTFKVLREAGQVTLLSDAAHAQHGLYLQARERLQQLPAGGFNAGRELDNAAAALAARAHANGLQRIDHVVTDRNRGLFAVQGELTDPAHHRMHVPDRQALGQPPVLQSSHELPSLELDASQQQEQQRRSMQMA